MKRIGYLVDEGRSPSREEEAAWSWLEAQSEWSRERIAFSRLKEAVDRCDLLWIHDDSSLLVPERYADRENAALLTRYVEQGGSLLLSLLAAQAVVPLGWESTAPNVVRKGTWDERCWAEDYPDIRGFSGFLGHPIFEGLQGAVYTWNPTPTTPFAGAFYEAPATPLEGRVVAVEKQYIKLNDRRRLIWEYGIGSGMVLAIGSSLFFQDANDRFRPHRELLTANCLRFLLEHPTSRSTYWDFSEREVREVRHSSPPVSITPTALAPENSDLAIVRAPGELRDAVVDVGGRRILVMGREQTGIQEIWTHPLRAAKDLQLGIRSGGHDVRWLRHVSPQVTVRPESIVRVFDLGDVHIEETTFTSRRDPVAAVHLVLTSPGPFELVVSCTVDLRLMWPFPPEASGSLLHGWDEGLRAFVIHNASEGLSSIVGTTRVPEQVLAGRFSGVTLGKGGLTGLQTERMEVGLGMRFACTDGTEELSLVVAGSDQGLAEAAASYRHALKHPGALLLHQVEHVKQLFASSTMVRTPDERFNSDYRWALAALDRFLVETPSLGTSLMAGFGTTERGWDGNQAISGRPGYAWYFARDAVWCALALVDAAQCESVREVLTFLGKHQDVTGKIIHELTTSGHAHYDAADSTPLYCILMGRYVTASADTAFARQEFSRLERAIKFCLSTDTDGDLLIENTNVGHGWVEGGKLFPVHTELYLAACWAEALSQASRVADLVGETETAREWEERSRKVRTRVAEEFWNERSDFYSFAKMADGSYRPEQTVLPAVAAYFKCVQPERMASGMRHLASAEFTSDWGVRIIGRSDAAFNAAGYHSGSVWPLFTGWTALAEFALERPLQGLAHLRQNLALGQAFAAGTREEVFHGERFEPAGVCSHQAWSESMAVQPVLEGLAGICADGNRMKLSLKPFLAASWEALVIEHIAVGEERVRVHLERKHGKISFALQTKARSPIAVSLQVLLPLGSVVHGRSINGKTTRLQTPIHRYGDSPVVAFTLSGKARGSVQYTEGVALEIPGGLPSVGSSSSGIRVLEEKVENGRYEMVLEAPTGAENRVVLWDMASRVQDVHGVARWARDEKRVIVTLDPKAELQPTGYRRSLVSVALKPVELGKDSHKRTP